MRTKSVVASAAIKYIAAIGCFLAAASALAEMAPPAEVLSSRPIILVHGFGGFERRPDDSFFYWGGFRDLQTELQVKGNFDVRTAFVGPFSSNWDRTCELYAYIKGGRVDYGAAHAAEFGHDRYGRTYPGLYPEWGETTDGRINTIDMIGHSMGGQTIRLLIHLLENGDGRENAGADDGETSPTSPLFTAGKRWVHACMTIATPHNGTTLSEGITESERLMRFVFWLSKPLMAGKSFIYPDYHIDQWNSGFGQIPFGSPLEPAFIAKAKKDLSFWDLSLAGATELNRFIALSSEVYYFSWATTKPPLAFLPDAFYLYPNAVYLDVYPQIASHDPAVTDAWRASDGVVNTISMSSPFLGRVDPCRDYDGQAVKGCWNMMGSLANTDHGQIVGLNLAPWSTIGGKDLYDWYAEQAALLAGLP